MSGEGRGVNLATEPDFTLASLSVSPSTCRVLAAGQDVRIEAKTMAVLVALARAVGATVTREDLIEACWEGRAVSDDAISRAIAKVRAVAGATSPPAFAIETVPKVGYRLVAAQAAAEPMVTVASNQAPPALPAALPRRWLPAAFVVVAVLGVTMVLGARAMNRPPVAPPSVATAHAAEIMDALMNLDQQRLVLYLGQGWDPNWKLDSEGNAALHQIMMVCERHPTHDRVAMERIVRFLVQSGADPTTRNRWNDTPLIIARTQRYCGPDHPVTAYLSELDENTPPPRVLRPRSKAPM